MDNINIDSINYEQEILGNNENIKTISINDNDNSNNDSTNTKELQSSPDSKYADIISVSYNEYHKKFITVYSDKTLFIWNIDSNKKCLIKNNENIQKKKTEIISIKN
jgi:WD40 repeat protein